MDDITGSSTLAPGSGPADQAIYQAFKDVKLFKKGIKKGSKNIETVITSRERRTDVQELISQHGREYLKIRIRYLVDGGVFAKSSVARQVFSASYLDTIVPIAEPTVPDEETTTDYDVPVAVDPDAWIAGSDIAGEAPAEELPAGGDWPVYVAPLTEGSYSPEVVAVPDEEVAAEVVARIVEDAVLEREASVNDTASTGEDTSYPEGSKSCSEQGDDKKDAKEPRTICLSFPSQHTIAVTLQRYLETACFASARAKLPELLQKRGWDCAEEVQLSTWMEEFSRDQMYSSASDQRRTNDASDDGDDDDDDDDHCDVQELFRSVAKIQNTAVNRIPTDLCGTRVFLSDAAQLVKVLGAEPYGELFNKMQLDIGKVIDNFSTEERRLRDRREKKLAHIHMERAKLDEMERTVLAGTDKDLRACQYSAGLEVHQRLDEAEKMFRADRFFDGLE